MIVHYLRKTAVVRQRIERRRIAIKCTIKQDMSKKLLKIQTHVKNARIGEAVSYSSVLFVVVKFEYLTRFPFVCALTSFVVNSTVIKSKKASRRVKTRIKHPRLILSVRFSRFVVFCNLLTADTGAPPDV